MSLSLLKEIAKFGTGLAKLNSGDAFAALDVYESGAEISVALLGGRDELSDALNDVLTKVTKAHEALRAEVRNDTVALADMDAIDQILTDKLPAYLIRTDQLTDAAFAAKGIEKSMTDQIIADLVLTKSQGFTQAALDYAAKLISAGIKAALASDQITKSTRINIDMEQARRIGMIQNDVGQLKTEVREGFAKLSEKIDLPRELIENLALRFGHDNPDAPPDELTRFLKDKAKDYRALQSQLDALQATDKRIENLVGAAKGALASDNMEEAQSLYCAAREIQRRERTEPALKQEQALYWAEAESHLFNDDAPKATDAFEEGATVLASLGDDDVCHARDEAAGRLYEHDVRYGGGGLIGAIKLWRNNLDTVTKDQNPSGWATTQNSLAVAFDEQGRRAGGQDGIALLAQAVKAYRDALQVWTQEAHAEDWAMTTMNLAVALDNQGSRVGGEDGIALLAEAVTAYRDALQVRTREAHPVGWARTTMNLAIALQQQGSRVGGEDGVALLAEAVTAYRDALQVNTREAHPVDWAMTTMNLAIALQEQGSRVGGEDGVALLAEAVTAYRDALQVRTRKAHPVQWAMTTMNLAIAVSKQGSRVGGEDGIALLAEAVTAYRDALQVYMRQAHPMNWAVTQHNLAATYEKLSGLEPEKAKTHLTEAIKCIDGALEVRTAEHMPHQHEMSSDNRDRINAKLDALNP